jgi:Tfp pilus assembly protein PilO
LGASDNQVTSVTILNIAKIRIKNNMTFMVTDLPSRHKLHGHIRNMKRVRTNSALSNNKKDIKNKDEKNESYRRKHLNKDTKDKYLKKERKVVPR